MRISHLVISGFRGVKDKIEIDLPPGFAVICGPNGSGKSTICDAIEYAITGKIRQSSDHREKGESIMDYLWWRGNLRAADHYVKIRFEEDNGKKHEFVRTSKNVMDDGPLENLLCEKDISPPSALKQLCRTMIIRDEEITKLSVDMKEIERFEFARSAIGAGNLDKYENMAESLGTTLEKNIGKHQKEYEEVRNKVSDLTARISELSVEAYKQSEIQSAIRIIKEITKITEPIEMELLITTNRKVAELRMRRDSLFRIQKEFSLLLDKQKEIETDEFKSHLESFHKKLNDVNRVYEEKKSKLNKFNIEIRSSQKKEPDLTSFAELYEHGKKLGMRNSCCPLCGSKVSSKEFETHLDEINQYVKKSSKELSDLVSFQNKLESEERQIQTEIINIKKEIESFSRSKEEIQNRIQLLMTEAKEYDLIFKSPQQFDLQTIKNEISKIQENISKLEKAQAILESSRTYEKIVSLRKQLQIAKSDSEGISKNIRKIEEKRLEIKDDYDTIRRVRGEIVEERIAELTPLMAEIYFRLRPHFDWQELSYHMRGDVRKFLSLEIGKGLNPSFIFSSGQRRAVGLSFLLAVHLSRLWCRNKTLILDDPIQHIDDYRALHLIEVLSAIRKLDRQIICTVQDTALADLLTRRLRSLDQAEGVLIKMEYVSNQGVKVIQKKSIPTYPGQVLIDS